LVANERIQSLVANGRIQNLVANGRIQNLVANGRIQNLVAEVMQVKKCPWSHNLMKRGGACGKWPRPILRRRIKGTRILQTSPDEGEF